MLRLLGAVFSLVSLGAIAAVGGLALVVWMYDRDLPSHDSLTAYEPATLSRVWSGDGELIAEFARERRIFTPIDEIPPLVKQAFISAEDKHFYTHPGVDALGIVKAMAQFAMDRAQGRDSRLRGASTITQQVMKNFLLSGDREIERKIKEMILSVRIEQALSKERILELYLNEIFLGQNAYGVAAAAQRYFGKTLEDLSVAEAAYLAALPQAPSDLHPVRARERAVWRRNYVIREMRENGYIAREEAEAARGEPLATLFDGGVASQVARPANPGYFAEEIRRQLTGRLGADMLYGGGLTIRATIDPELQKVAGDALRERIWRWEKDRRGYAGPAARIEELDPADPSNWRPRLARVDAARDVGDWRLGVVLEVTGEGARIGFKDPEAEPGLVPFSDVSGWARPALENGRRGPAPRAPSDVWSVGDVIYATPDGEGEGWSMRQIPKLQGAFMAMDVATGRVLALQGGVSYETSVFNRATQAERQPGSAFKPFVYAAALDQGYTPATVILDAPVVVQTGGEIWTPKNSSGTYYGPSPMRLGLEMSRNLMTIRLAQDVGMDTIADYAERFGVYDDMPEHLSLSLGAGETTLYKMVAAYASFANGGRRLEPTLVDRVQDRRGETIYRHDERLCLGCEGRFDGDEPPRPIQTVDRIMDPVTAYQVISMLRGVVERGTASRPFADVDLPIAGKTGTTNDSKDAWFIGFTPAIAAGCFIGHDDPRSMGDRAYGGTLCAPVVAEFMEAAHARREPGEFERPEAIEVVPVNRWTGERVASATGGDVIAEVFREGWAPGLYESQRVIGSVGDRFFFGAGDDYFPETLESAEAPAQPSGGGGRSAPAIGGGFGSPGGLY